MARLLNFSGLRPFPVIRQTEAAECGLACLAMISSYHGHRIDLNTLRRRHPVSLKGRHAQGADSGGEPDAARLPTAALRT